ncbi:MAG: hypothetical protein K9J81_11940, partial [Desulfohalobiaceae bacterium]|nr:hypothetical protein [Desulfohalobiaceae bacterium]
TFKMKKVDYCPLITQIDTDVFSFCLSAIRGWQANAIAMRHGRKAFLLEVSPSQASQLASPRQG